MLFNLCMLHTEYTIVLLADGNLLRTRRPGDISSPLLRHRVLVLPLVDGIKISTLVVDGKVRERVGLCLDPVERDNVQVPVAHQILHQDIRTVADMHPVQIGKWLLGRAVAVVLGPCQVTEEIEAVDLVKHVDLRHVGIVTKAVLGRELDEELRILSQPTDFLLGDGEDADNLQVLPCIINCWVGFEVVAPLGGIFCFKQTSFCLLGRHLEVD